MNLTKIALDAQKARAMAEAAGIIPHPGSAWKWALRNSRDSRGNVLQGKALEDAQLKMGRLPHRDRQRFESLNRATGGRYELGMALGNQVTPSAADAMPVRKTLNDALKQERPPVDQNVVDGFHAMTGENPIDAPMKSRNLGKMNVGTEMFTPLQTELGAHPSIMSGAGGAFAHTHPAHSRFGAQVKESQQLSMIDNLLGGDKQQRQNTVEMISEGMPHINMPKDAPDDLKDAALQRFTNMLEMQKGKIQKDYGRLKNPVEAVSPSGKYTDQGGDMDYFRAHPYKDFPIMSPERNVDAVHRVKDQSQFKEQMLSDYFDLINQRDALKPLNFTEHPEQLRQGLDSIHKRMNQLTQQAKQQKEKELRSVYWKTQRDR